MFSKPTYGIFTLPSYALLMNLDVHAWKPSIHEELALGNHYVVICRTINIIENNLFE